MIEEIIQLISEKKFTEIHQRLIAMQAVDIAQLLETIDDVDLFILYRMLPKEQATEVFAYFSGETQERLVVAMTEKEVGLIINELFLDDAVDFIEEMPATVVKKVLSSANEQTRKAINQYLQYPEFSSGSLMTNEFVDLRVSMTVEEAFTRIRKIGVDKETIYTCFVIDENRFLIGTMSARKLMLATPETPIKTLMDTKSIVVSTLDDQEHVAQLFRKYDLLSVPVVDKENRLVGIITIDDIIDVIQQENTEDFEKMAAILPSDDTYLRTSAWSHAMKRLPWLFILMISATVTGMILQSYEHTFEVLPVLVTFIPMLMDTGGNSGQQAATLVIRGMALDEIKVADIFHVVFKEMRVSIVVAAVLTLANMARIYFLGGDMIIAFVVGITLFLTIVIAKLIGGFLPLMAKGLHLDPALVAAPMITTLVDAASMFVYFSVANLFFSSIFN